MYSNNLIVLILPTIVAIFLIDSTSSTVAKVSTLKKNSNSKKFIDPIQTFRENYLKKTRLAFRSADAQPIGIAPLEETTVSTSIKTTTSKKRISEIEAKRVEWLKKTLLEKLKLSEPPNVTQSNRIPPNSPVMKALLQEYGIDQIKANEMKDMEDEIKSQKLISISKPLPFNDSLKFSNSYYFNFSQEERANFRVASAKLWYYIRDTKSPSPSAFVELNVLRPYFNETEGQQTKIAQRYAIKRLNFTNGADAETWQHISVTELVSNWFNNPESNFGIQLFSRRVRNLVATGSLPTEAGFKPFLEVQLVADHRRRKRSTENQCSNEDGTKNLCCHHQFTINFEEIGWDWIIFPTSYDARICAGECITDQIPSIHTSIVEATQNREVNARPAELGRPNQSKNCCVPTKYAPLTMLYYDNQGNTIYSDVPDMEIRKCGCV